MSQSNNNNSCMLKIHFRDEIRKFPFEGDSFNNLLDTIKKMFSLNVSDTINIRYIDNDNDRIVLSSDEELKEAIKIAKGASVKLSITVVHSVSPSTVNNVPNSVPRTPVQQPASENSTTPVPSVGPIVPLMGMHPHLRWGRHCHDKDVKKEHCHDKDDKKEHHHCANRRGEWKEKKWAWKAAKKEIHDMQSTQSQQSKDSIKELREKIHELKAQLREQRLANRRCPKEGSKMATVLEDVTIPDNTVLTPGQQFVKTWKLKNESDCAWPAGSKLILGRHTDRMGAPDFLPIASEVQPKQEVTISVPLQAPVQPGKYTTVFRLAGPKGRKFGQRIWTQIMVQA